MKADIHPDYHEITVVHTDGSKHPMRSTWGKPGDVLSLDIDPLNHPAWLGGKGQKVLERGQLSKFEKRFGGFMASTGEEKEDAKGGKK
ncbi:MAG: 50S ribosomal protein L31 [Alphaproteobacteria bacterium]|nr:50S ribosomal protein L31 [Alphaproteobacteria bacterium]